MARIPTYISDGALPNAPSVVPGALAAPADFGAGIGEATARVGAAEQQTGAAIIGTGVAAGDLGESLQVRQNKLETANHTAKFDFAATFNTMQTGVGADPTGFQQNVGNAFDKTVDDYVNKLPVNETVRTNVKTALMSQRPGYMTQAASFERIVLDARDKLDANTGLQVQNNRVTTDPAIETYRDAVAKSDAVIDAQPGLPQIQKDQMKFANAQELALNRFRGLEQNAKDDPLALQAVKDELQGDEWAKKMKPDDRFAMLERLDRNIKSANTAEAAAGRAAIQNIRQRNTDGVPVDDAEMAGVRDAVTKSNRPELMSQFAMMAARNEVFKNGRSLPLSEQRASYDKALKAGGVANLPQPIKDGIRDGAALTNGTIGEAFLAGLVNAEYGHKIGSGDYGAPTGNLNSKGQRGSDAIGIAQFTGKTFLDTVRQHADELGVSAALSDDALLKMRADPNFSIRAAALHAADNKRQLESDLGRPVSDGDLYFAHFLGVNGAKRFLTAADANPKQIATANVAADQVDANRNVFFDNGKPRTNEQVRAYMTNAMMNGPSRVDYSEAKAWQTTINATVKGLKEDPMAFAQSTGGKFQDIGDINTPEGMQRRGVAAQQVAEFYGVPTADFKPFTKDEIEVLGKKARDGSADETLQVMSSVAGLGGAMAKAGFKQIGEKDTLFGYAAGLAYVGGDKSAASDIIRGEKRMKEDKDMKMAIGQSDADMTASFQSIVGKAVMGTAAGTEVRKAAEAYYVEKYLARGSASVGKFDKTLFEDSVHAVLGGGASPDGKAIGRFNGAQTKLPQGLNVDTFSTAINQMTVADYGALSKWGGPPRYSDGTLAKPDEIAREGKFEWIGANEYRIKMADNTYLLSGIQDKRATPYIFIGDPKTLSQYAARAPRNAMKPGDVPPAAVQ